MSDTSTKRKSISRIPKLNKEEKKKSFGKLVNQSTQSIDSPISKTLHSASAMVESKKLSSAFMFMKLLTDKMESDPNTIKDTDNCIEQNTITDLLEAIFEINDSLSPITDSGSISRSNMTDFHRSCSQSNLSEKHFDNSIVTTSNFIEVTKKSTVHNEGNDQIYYYAQQIIANNMEESTIIKDGLRELGNKIYIDKELYKQLLDLHNLLNDTIIKLKNKERQMIQTDIKKEHSDTKTKNKEKDKDKTNKNKDKDKNEPKYFDRPIKTEPGRVKRERSNSNEDKKVIKLFEDGSIKTEELHGDVDKKPFTKSKFNHPKWSGNEFPHVKVEDKKPSRGLFGAIRDRQSKHKEDHKPGFFSKIKTESGSDEMKSESPAKLNEDIKKPGIISKLKSMTDQMKKPDKPRIVKCEQCTGEIVGYGHPKPESNTSTPGKAAKSSKGSEIRQYQVYNTQKYIQCIQALDEIKKCLEKAVNSGIDISEQIKIDVDNKNNLGKNTRLHMTIDGVPMVMQHIKDRKFSTDKLRSGNSISGDHEIRRNTPINYQVFSNASNKQIDSKHTMSSAKHKVKYDSDSNPDIPYTADKSSLPNMEICNDVCSSLKFDASTIPSSMRDTGIYHPDGEVLKTLLRYPINEIIGSCRPAKCCRKAILNEKPHGYRPYAASLKSLPLINMDVEKIKDIIKSNVKFYTYSAYTIFEHYINFQKNVINDKFACALFTPLFEVRFFEIFKKEDSNSDDQSSSNGKTHDLKILDFIRKIYNSEPLGNKKPKESKEKNINIRPRHHHKHRKNRQLETKECQVESYVPPKHNFVTTSSSSSFVPSVVSLPGKQNPNESMNSFLLIPKSEVSSYFSEEMSTSYTPSVNSLPLEEIDVSKSAIKMENATGGEFDDSSLTPGNYAETLDAIYELDENGKMRPKSNINLLNPQMYLNQQSKENPKRELQSNLSTIHEFDEKERKKEHEYESRVLLELSHPIVKNKRQLPAKVGECKKTHQYSPNKRSHQNLKMQKMPSVNCNTCFGDNWPVYKQVVGIGPVYKINAKERCKKDNSPARGNVKVILSEIRPKPTGTPSNNNSGNFKHDTTTKTVDGKSSHKLAIEKKQNQENETKGTRNDTKTRFSNSGPNKVVKKGNVELKSAETSTIPLKTKKPKPEIHIDKNVVTYVINSKESNESGTSTNICSWPPPVKNTVRKVTHVNSKNPFFVSVHKNDSELMINAQNVTRSLLAEERKKLLNRDTQQNQKIPEMCNTCKRPLTDFVAETINEFEFPEAKSICKYCTLNMDEKNNKVPNLCRENFIVGYVGCQSGENTRRILKECTVSPEKKGDLKTLGNKKKKVKHVSPEVIDIKMAKNVKSTVLQQSYYNGQNRPGYVTVLKTPCNCPDITIFIPCYCNNYKCSQTIQTSPLMQKNSEYTMIPLKEQSYVDCDKKS